MVFLLSIRRCRFYLEEWTKGRKGPGRKIRGSSKPPTEVFGFHQTLKKKKKKQGNQKKKPSSHACYQGVYRFDLKGFEITPREETLRRSFYSKCGLKSNKAAGTSTWTYLCKIFLPRITAWTERFKSDWRERQRDSIVRSQTHKRTLKHVFCKTTVLIWSEQS